MYHAPAPPRARRLAHASVAEAVKEGLGAERERLDPRGLWQRFREGQAALAALAAGDLGSGPERERLEQCVAKRPDRRRDGAAGPTCRQTKSPARSWRTREDPCDGVRAEVPVWLPADPAATAETLLERRQREDPGRFPQGPLRTLRRRMREWRRARARESGDASQEGPIGGEPPVVLGPAAGAGRGPLAPSAASEGSESVPG